MNDLVNLGNTIKEKRLSLNLRMEDLASVANVSRANIWAIENAKGNYSVGTLFSILNALDLKIDFQNEGDKHFKRKRATRKISSKDKKINRFVNMCIEQYALSRNYSSKKAFSLMNKNNIVEELNKDYEDLHGMSTEYLNDYIDVVIGGKRG